MLARTRRFRSARLGVLAGALGLLLVALSAAPAGATTAPARAFLAPWQLCSACETPALAVNANTAGDSAAGAFNHAAAMISGSLTRRTFVVHVHANGDATLENVHTRERLAVTDLDTVGPQIRGWLGGDAVEDEARD